MAKTPAALPQNKPSSGRWGFFAPITALLSAFPHATTGQKASVVAMSFLVVMFMGLGLVGSVGWPPWAVVLMFVLVVVSILSVSGMLLFIEKAVTAPFRCRDTPVFPPEPGTRTAIRRGLEEIRQDAANQLRAKDSRIQDNNVRANIFLLAQIQGGAYDGKWRLVIHEDFALNMNHPPERQLQFSIGQGATGVAYRDGTYQLTRRQPSPQGQWDRKFQMTPELEAQVHKDLKWIVSFPLLKTNTSEAIGVLNIDGLVDVLDDRVLHDMATLIQSKVNVIAQHLALQPSTCVGTDQLGVM